MTGPGRVGNRPAPPQPVVWCIASPASDGYRRSLGAGIVAQKQGMLIL